MVLELSSDGSVVTSDDPPMVLGTLAPDFLEQVSPCLLLKNLRGFFNNMRKCPNLSAVNSIFSHEM